MDYKNNYHKPYNGSRRSYFADHRIKGKRINNGMFLSFFKFRTAVSVVLTATASLAVIYGVAYAGNLIPTSLPGVSTGYTLAEIYGRLQGNATTTEGGHTFGPSDSPTSTMYTLKDIYEAIPTIVADQVKSGTTYLGTLGTLVPNGGTGAIADLFSGKTAHLSGDWDLDTGTLNLACNTATFDGTDNKVADGYDGDGDGTNRWCMTNSGTATVADIIKGKIAWINGIALTGTYDPYTNQKNQTIDDWQNSVATTTEYVGEEASWSNSSYAGYDGIDFATIGDNDKILDLKSGRVDVDARSGLWWTDVAAVGSTITTTTNEFISAGDGQRPTGGNAINFCAALNSYDSGAGFAGYNDWYLPTQKELMQAYIDGSANNIANPGYTFWSSTERSGNAANAWYVLLNYGSTNSNTKVTGYYVRCVRRP